MITIQITPESAKRVKELGAKLPRQIMEGIARALDYENELTTGHIQAKRMSQRGPETLGVITNRLRRSLRPAKAVIAGRSVVSSIGSNVVYMGPHEFGFQGEVEIPEHTRQTATRFSIDDGRRTVTRSQAARLGLLTKAGRGRKGAADEVAGREVKVKAHKRMLNIAERAPIRRGIEERSARYTAAISAAIMEVQA